jgi:hypothetical protein
MILLPAPSVSQINLLTLIYNVSHLVWVRESELNFSGKIGRVSNLKED